MRKGRLNIYPIDATKMHPHSKIFLSYFSLFFPTFKQILVKSIFSKLTSRKKKVSQMW
uniref:Uncharacterized protein n=1 Tax=Rhizophora mucronata TaxID=61149 RepID=A0A2P2NED7_RHIMU